VSGITFGRGRTLLFALLGVLLLGNLLILISYNVFYESRLAALVNTRRELEKRLETARTSLEKVQNTAERLRAQRDRLDTFYVETLGSRKERLALLIDDVYASTKKAGFIPDSFAFDEGEAPGARRIGITFAIEGRYVDIKKLLGVFEANPGFLVLEKVGVTTDEAQPDVLKVALTVSHYFREEGGAGARRRAPRTSTVRTGKTTIRTGSSIGRKGPS
jgi:Tfp pilus assembly protein PilO